MFFEDRQVSVRSNFKSPLFSIIHLIGKLCQPECHPTCLIQTKRDSRHQKAYRRLHTNGISFNNVISFITQMTQ